MTGVYAIGEVVDDSNKRPKKTILCILMDDDGLSFSEGKRRSLESVQRMVRGNGAFVFEELNTLAQFLNEQGE
jgi:hypothetical protein